MTLPMIGQVLLDEPGDGSGGAAAVPAADAQSATPVAEPQAIDLDENALIRIKGSNKPVKFGEHVRGFQSQFTKASQKAAELERQLQARDAQLQRYEQARQRASQQGQQPDVFESLRALPYLKGEDAVEIVQSIGQQIQQRDQVLLAALQQMQQMQRVLSGLNDTSTEASFDAKITRFLSEGGYDAGLKNFAKELYVAYEGDDLDQDFPRILKERLDEIQTVLDTQKQAKLRAARGMPFVPGKGGQAGPSKPLTLAPDASPRMIADQLWDQLQAGSGT